MNININMRIYDPYPFHIKHSPKYDYNYYIYIYYGHVSLFAFDSMESWVIIVIKTAQYLTPKNQTYSTTPVNWRP